MNRDGEAPARRDGDATASDTGRRKPGRRRRILSAVFAVALLISTLTFFGMLVAGHVVESIGRVAVESANARLPVGRLAVDDIRPVWIWRERRFGLDLAGLRLELEDGVPVAAAESVSIGFSLQDLFAGQVVPEALTIDGLSAFVDVTARDGPALVTEDRSRAFPLSTLPLAGGAGASTPGTLAVRSARLGVLLAPSLPAWDLVDSAIDVSVAQGVGALELSASVGNEGEQGWIELRADWGAGLPPEVAVAIGGVSVRKLVSARVESGQGLQRIADLAVFGSAQIALDEEFRPRTVEGEVLLERGDSSVASESGVRRAEGLFLYDAESKTLRLSDLAIDAVRYEAAGDAVVELAAGSPGRILGFVEFASDGSPLGRLQGEAEFSAEADGSRLEFSSLSARTDRGTLQGNARLDEWTVDEEGFRGQIRHGEATLRSAGESGNDSEGEGASDRAAYVISGLQGDFLYDPSAYRIRVGQAAAEVDGSPVRLEEVSLALADPLESVTGSAELGPASASRIAAIWPPEIAARTRSWFRKNVRSGSLTVGLEAEGTGPDREIRGRLDFSDAAFAPVEGIAGIRAAAGSATLVDNRFRVVLDRGFWSEEGRGESSVRGVFDIGDVSADAVRASTFLEGEGDVSDFARAVGGVLRADAPDALGMLGEASGRIEFAGSLELELGASVAVSDWQLRTELHALSIPADAVGIAVEQGRVRAEFGAGGAAASGEFRADGTAVSFDLRRSGSAEGSDGTQVWRVSGTAEPPGFARRAFSARSIPYVLEATSDADGARWEAELDLVGGAVTLADARLKSEAEAGSLRVSGISGRDGTSLSTFALRLPRMRLRGSPVAGQDGSWQVPLEGTVDAGVLREIGLPLLGEAPLPVSAGIRYREEGPTDVAVRIDLSSTRIDSARAGLDVLGVQEEAGAGAHLRTDGALADGRFRLRSFSGAFGGLDFLGEETDPTDEATEQAWSAELRVRDSSRFSLELGILGDGRVRADLVGDVLDVSGSPRLAEARESGPGEGVDADNEDEVELRINVRRLQVREDLWLEDASGQVYAQGGGIAGSIQGLALGLVPAEILISQTPEGENRYVISLDDAGSVLSALGITSRAEGGSMRVIPLASPDSGDRPSYLVQISNLRVRSAPLVGKLLAFISGVGLIEYVLTGNFQMNSVTLTVAEDGELMRISRGSVESPTVAVAFKGEYDRAADEVDLIGYGTPLRFVSRALGDLPIIGNVVKGPDGKGIIGVGFAIRGPADDPTVDGSPLDLLIPLLPQLRYRQNPVGDGPASDP